MNVMLNSNRSPARPEMVCVREKSLFLCEVSRGGEEV